MQESGQGARDAATGAFAALQTPRAMAALGLFCALLPALAMWGFTVDDALIPVRYAHNIATGAGYRFDAHGPVTDGVTPLPWAWMLAPLAGGADPLATLGLAKALGVAAWAVAGGVLGARVGALACGGRGERASRALLAALALLVMALAFPIGAWAASGMETGLATAIATCAIARLGVGRWWLVAVIAGLVPALRPEMVVWAIAVGAGAAALERGARLARVVAGAALGSWAFAVCALVRLVAFGRVAPLSVLAKPSDLTHGATYAAAAALVVLTPVLVIAPVTILRGRASPLALVVVLAFGAHVLAVVAAGGDWMPYARLMVPVAPSLVLAFVEIARASRLATSAARIAAAMVLGGLVAARAAPAGRGVQRDRVELIGRARPTLAGARVVAALDVGWVGASTDARIVDLAGLTDEAIAALPGGHTSKRVDVSMLLDRGVDVVVVYSELRVVEARIVSSALFAERFEAAERLPLGSRGAFYTLYRRRA